MSILIDENTVALIQGITGRAGTSVTKMMLGYGTKVAAGVTPGKGGENVEGVPVYDTVAEALAEHPEINTSLVYVPPVGAKDAAFEAIDAGIKLVHIFTEKVPIQDAAEIFARARMKGVRVVGPASVGIISPGKAKIGSIGGNSPERVFQKGSIGIISKSGGMSSEISWLLKQSGLGQSTVVGIGGDVIACTNMADLMLEFEKDKDTEAVVIFGEIGGMYEHQAAKLISEGKFTKPVVAFISGRFAEYINTESALGHAGAIIEGGKDTRQSKVEALKKVGVKIAEVPDEIPEILRGVLR